MSIEPPKRALQFLRWFCREDYLEEFEGDLVELFEKYYEESPGKARRKFFWGVLRCFRPGFMKAFYKVSHSNSLIMFNNYFKLAWRNILKNRSFSSINISGLSIGMAAAMIVALWVVDEFAFNSHFENKNRLAQVILIQTMNGVSYTGETIATPTADALLSVFGSSFKKISLVSYDRDAILSIDNKKLSRTGRWVEAGFPEMFSLNMLAGNRAALSDPSTMLLSESVAKALFGEVDPIGRTIRIDNRFEMQVGGVYEDFPLNTTFYNTQFLMSWSNRVNFMNRITNWNNHSCQLFVQLNDDADLYELSDRIRNIPSPFFDEWKEELMLYPLDKLHLYFPLEDEGNVGYRVQVVRVVAVIGGAILLLACINFMNLSTARSEKRAKEVGIRKAIGSQRNQLVAQFLVESVVVTLLSLVFAILITQLTLPFFNNLLNKQMFIQWSNPVFWAVVLGFVLLIGIISGSYPALYLSSFKPVKILKGIGKGDNLSALPRRILVVAQFTVSISLLIATVIVFRQIQVAKARPVGYSRDNLISVSINTPGLNDYYDVLQNDLLGSGLVDLMASSTQQVTYFYNNNSVDWRGKNQAKEVFFRDVGVSPEFGNTVGWKIVNGRDFNNEIKSDTASVLINEAAARAMGFDDPVGEKVKYFGREFTVIGVVGNMITQSPYISVPPSIFLPAINPNIITLRINSGLELNEAISGIQAIFERYNTNEPFDFRFVDQEYDRKFSEESQVGLISTIFASLTIFISCLGIFGLASFVAEQRTKEMGVRKVLGASILNLWTLLSKDFLWLVLISIFLAIPLSYYFMGNWLDKYEYRTGLAWWIFVVSALGALIITLATVSYQSIKTAMVNPAKSLRTE